MENARPKDKAPKIGQTVDGQKKTRIFCQVYRRNDTNKADRTNESLTKPTNGLSAYIADRNIIRRTD